MYCNWDDLNSEGITILSILQTVRELLEGTVFTIAEMLFGVLYFLSVFPAWGVDVPEPAESAGCHGNQRGCSHHQHGAGARRPADVNTAPGNWTLTSLTYCS